MIPDGNMDLHEGMKSPAVATTWVAYTFFLIIWIFLKDNLLLKQK